MLDRKSGEPALAEQRQSVIDFARFCLPQVFFYGMFVLVGQILNSRGRFGPMMWAPIANNVISVAVLVVYLIAFGPGHATRSRSAPSRTRPGAAARPRLDRRDRAQFLILVPYLQSRATPTVRASTSAHRSSATPSGWASGRCCS